MFVKPAPGLVVRDPQTRVQVPEDGRDVPETSYWLRRLRDGDLVQAAQPGPAPKSAPAAAPAAPQS